MNSLKLLLEHFKHWTGLFWIDANYIPPRKDVPILIAVDYEDFPLCHQYAEQKYGYGFYDSLGEYMLVGKDIQYWRKAPAMPFVKKLSEYRYLNDGDYED